MKGKKMFLGTLRAPMLPVAAVVTALSFATFHPVSVQGAVVFEERFEDDRIPTVGKARVVQTEDGFRGFTVMRSGKEDIGGLLLPGNVPRLLRGPRGTMEFWLQRRDEAGQRRNPVLEFVDGENRSFLTIYVQWEGGQFGSGGEILLDGKRTADPAYDLNVWGEIVPLGFTPQAGEWVHLAFTYGEDEGDNRVFVNGRPVKSAYPPVGSFAQVQGTALGPVTMKNGRLDLSGVDEIRVGAEGRNWDKGPGRGSTYLEHSILDELRFHDDVVTSFDLSRIAVTTAEPEIRSLEHNALNAAGFSGKLVAGDMVTVSLEGTPGTEASFDIARLAEAFGEIHLDWRGYGVFLEEKVFFDEDEVNLREVEEYHVYVSTEPFATVSGDMEPVDILEVEDQAYTIEGLEIDVPYYVAVAAAMSDGTFQPVIWPLAGIAAEEDPDRPGSYEGTFVVDYRDRYPKALVVGHLLSGSARATGIDPEEFQIDARLTIAVHTTPGELEADEKSRAEVLVTVTDANEEPVAGHEIGFTLATTSRFTGVVGGGEFADEVGGALRRDFRGVTDLFGQVTATYTSGFAAKTAIIVARDMLSNDTGAGYVKTFIRAAAGLELEAAQEVAGKALGYSIVVTSSDEWLTADGESRARITALVTGDGIPVEGHRVAFRVASGSGSIRTVAGTTDGSGKARAVYTAGRKIGVALITATDHDAGISGSVRIELRSDAPAKIAIAIDPDVLPADGRSIAQIEVTVTDTNDNPNEDVEVEYKIAMGRGRLKRVEAVTDEDGISTAEFVAGKVPGGVSIEVTVRSIVPTEEEMRAARDLSLAVPDYAFF